MKTFGKALLIFLDVCFLLTGLISGQPVIFEAQRLKNGLNIYYQKEADLKITTIFFSFPEDRGSNQKTKPAFLIWPPV